MKIIFSRKGFDSQFGSADSPILPDGRMISIPIPADDREKGIGYDKIFIEQDMSYLDLMNNLKIKPQTKDGQLAKECHLDPDLRFAAIDRETKWRPLFGQSGISRIHLSKSMVSKGDIFLFFGSFRGTFYKDNRLSFSREHSRHIIFGYLIVDEIWDLGKEGIQNFKTKNLSYSWAFQHPHFYYEKDKDNALFVSAKNGAGVFKYRDELALTKLGYLKSVWELPAFFSPDNVSISYHNNSQRFQKHKDKILLQTVGKGQEFVVESNDKTGKLLEEWTHKLIDNSEKYE